jgi:hypothetical protein
MLNLLFRLPVAHLRERGLALNGIAKQQAKNLASQLFFRTRNLHPVRLDFRARAKPLACAKCAEDSDEA